jgi:hypothetical protein
VVGVHLLEAVVAGDERVEGGECGRGADWDVLEQK